MTDKAKAPKDPEADARRRVKVLAAAEAIELRAVTTDEHPKGALIADAPTAAIERELARRGLLPEAD